MRRSSLIVLTVGVAAALAIASDHADAKKSKGKGTSSGVSHHDISFTHQVDKSSPVLMQRGSGSPKSGSTGGSPQGSRK